MKINRTFTSIFVIIFILMTGCASNSESDVAKNENESQTDTSSGEKTNENGTYPMPILSGWEEIEIIFETIGGGNIDVWHGEFSFSGEIDDYFEPYQAALTDMGFEVTVTQDDEGMKTLDIAKVIDGDKHVGNVLFTDRWVKSSLQHFK